MNSKDEENNLLKRLDVLEKRLESIDDSLNRLIQDAERRTERREAGWLTLAVILGGLLSISVNLWTDYYMLAVAPNINILTLVAVTVILVVVFAFFLWREIIQLR